MTVESVDYDALIVHLRSQPSLADVPLGSEGGRADAERVTELAGAPKSGRTGDVAGPTDRSGTWFIAFASFALGMLTLLAVVMGPQPSLGRLVAPRGSCSPSPCFSS
jgi:hypothetical protein